MLHVSSFVRATVAVAACVLLLADLPSAYARVQPPTNLGLHDESSRELSSNDSREISNDEAAIESYFIVEYAANFDSLANIQRAAEALAVAYNKLILLYDDPYNRRMDVVDGVDILEASVLDDRRLNRGQVRAVSIDMIHTSQSDASVPNKQADQERVLQRRTRRILALLRQRGTSSYGCPGDCSYSDDSLRRALGAGSEQGSNGEYSGYDNDDSNDDDAGNGSSDDMGDDDAGGESSDDSSDDSSGDSNDDSNDDSVGSSGDDTSESSSESSNEDDSNAPLPPQPPLRPGLPSEEAILLAYSAEVRALGMPNIFDVTALDEVDEPPGGEGRWNSRDSKDSKASQDSGWNSRDSKDSKASQDSDAGIGGKSGKGNKIAGYKKRSGSSDSSKSHKKGSKSGSLRRKTIRST